MFLSIIGLVVGFIVLIKGADIFVDGSSSIANNFKVSKLLVGLTIVAFGTSAPELAVSIQSHLKGAGDILVGNVIGSNILNILLILGFCACIKPIDIKSATVKKELPILMMVTTLLSVLLLDKVFENGNTNILSRSDGIIIILFFLVFIYYLISIIRHKKTDEVEKAKYSITKSIIFTILGIGLIILGSDCVVKAATNIAKLMGVSERLIALTIVALGTSLPELVTSIVSIFKGEQDILVGNIVGSNIFNICLVLGIPIVTLGSVSANGFSYLDLVIFLISAMMLFIFSIYHRKAHSSYKINRFAGIIMLITFVIYYSFIIIEGVM